MKIGVKEFEKKPKKDEELEADEFMTRVLMTYHSDKIDIDRRRKRFRRTPVYIQIILFAIILILNVYYRSNAYHLSLITCFLVMLTSVLCNLLFFPWLQSLSSLNLDYWFLELQSRFLHDHATKAGFINVNWKQALPVMEYRQCVIDICYIGACILFFIGHIIASILLFRQMDPLCYKTAVFQLWFTWIPVLCCLISFYLSCKNMWWLRKANRNINTILSNC
uniref:Uncharacterized protein n=1 Tax=Caenorhabditis tropicalis TaxID=1561998 RepID=A0A1I7ULQ7_9PELO